MNPICFVIPPSPFLLDERVFMSLGVLKISAVLEKENIPVEVIDLSGIENFKEALEFHARKTEAKIFGFTATTPQMPQAAKLAGVLKQVRPDAKTIIGGPHPTLTYAAYKKELAKGVTGRAHRSLKQLTDTFDTVVCGDGERAIFLSIKDDAPKIIDADDPKTDLFLTNKALNDMPFPARHLVDVDSYHYKIDGVPALSLIAQLGCLTGDTCITMGNGLQCPIRDVQKGDVVLSYDTEERCYRKMPVKDTWKREADDLYELTFDDGTILKVTAEHPLWTTSGWSTVEELCPMQDQIYFHDSSARKVLFKPMLRELAENSLQRELVESGSSSHAKKMESHDTRGTQSLWGSSAKEYAKIEANKLVIKNGRQKSDETSRSGGEGFSDHQEKMGELLFRTNEKDVEVGEAETIVAVGSDTNQSKQVGNDFKGNLESDNPFFSVGRKFRFLDWALQVWEKTKSRFLGQKAEEGDSSSWGVLSFSGVKRDRSGRLSEQRVQDVGRLVQGVGHEESGYSERKDTFVWNKLISKKFVGKVTVYNLTIHPVHTYFANNLLVHNCPFACGFCGGRNSPMLRRIRTRTTQSVVDEITHMHKEYGAQGFMLYDDELNVNPQMVQLMNAISDKQEELGVEFKLRGFIKSQLFTDEQAQAMYRAGFRWILTGFESGSPRILENINKKATREENTRCVDIAHRHNLKVKALMSMGHPGESMETLKETEDWLIENKPEDFDVTIITPYPGSPYFDDAVEENGAWVYTTKNGDKLFSQEVDYFEKADFYKGGLDDYKSYVWTPALSSEEIVQQRDRLERTVRQRLGIPFNQAQKAATFEHSMGQSELPSSILRRSRQLLVT